MMTKKLLTDESGVILALTAIFLPVVLLVGGLIVEGGLYYERQAQLNKIARQSANSSIIELLEIIDARAQLNKNRLCSVLFPPNICRSTNRFDFITQVEIEAILSGTSNQMRIENAAKSYGRLFDPKNFLQEEDLSVSIKPIGTPIYQIQATTSIEASPDLLFSTVLQSSPIIVTSNAFLKISS